ncbi:MULTISPECIES: histidine--tRNA ligase [Aerococcus]|uniref:Histidine--tRNA ligase n=2 Tax=Aerococcus TaxID=1375 RepID=A0A329PIW7_9LACT|nr:MULTISPECIES: histidine--tRNA ligase [Aerococcus]KAA9240693.1 histidine--tRNA ligase [Aerococcus urinae]KAA9292328.1 histidine--tRNA ligase [Aerococcus mictus]KAA9299387.1 histidine--tRNA ligase [Aerococcus tenax]MCY3034234.1 histidine--tRNA ligase [Aerococcus mictus]MCY3064006.1 histidine--tRNA ligase [Aerococcus mictus]
MIQKPKGTVDILPGQVEIWQAIEKTARDIMAKYRFNEIRTPMFESYDLFARGVGETTDVVTKEMYDFYDKGDRHIALKPEGTAPIVRAFIENKLYGPEHIKPYKVYYISPMFRYERPQGGRQRQFHQLGVEVFDGKTVLSDVETIALAWEILETLGVKDLKLVINSLGDNEARLDYREALINYLKPFEEELSEDSKTRLYQNPLRVLDSKDAKDKEIVKDAPKILDYLSEASKERFEQVQSLLAALNIPYQIDSNMVRGLDYYQDTIFEIMTNNEVFGAETTICGGGSYSGLVKELSEGREDVPGFGFAIGMERLILLLEAQKSDLAVENPLDIYLVTIGQSVVTEALQIVQALRRQGLNVEFDLNQRKTKKQFRDADRHGAAYTLTLGESELADKNINVKNMNSGKERHFAIDDVIEHFDQVKKAMKEGND